MPDAPRGIGPTCTGDTDCDPGMVCLSQAMHPAYVGGYCTVRHCATTCPPGSVCVGGGGVGSTICVVACADATTCGRYTCCAAQGGLCAPSGAFGCP